MAINKRNSLGRGLASLIPEATSPRGGSTPGGTSPAGGVQHIALDQIRPNPRQPRKHFDERTLTGLVESIRSNGVIQPILLRRTDTGFEIIAGERRYRAAGRAGLLSIPAIVRDVDGDGDSLELALIENLQREDLNPIETAEGYQRLIDEYSYTQDELARRLGKDRSSITNALRLLRLPEEVLDALAAGVISSGHGKALLGMEDDDAVRQAFQKLVERQLNVRQTEQLIKKLREKPVSSSVEVSLEVVEGEVRALRSVAERLSRYLATRVTVEPGRRGRGGTLLIEYYSEEDLSRLVDRIEEGL